MNQTIKFQKDSEKKQIIVSSEYQQSVEKLWNAFTQTETLEKWWAPEPYKAIVVSNNFSEGGRLLYYMLSPEGEKTYCLADYLSIDPMKSYEVFDAFCDENGVINTDFPRMKWLNTFNNQNGTTTVTNTITFENTQYMEEVLKMGFELGYTMGLNQLYDLLNQ